MSSAEVINAPTSHFFAWASHKFTRWGLLDTSVCDIMFDSKKQKKARWTMEVDRQNIRKRVQLNDQGRIWNKPRQSNILISLT